jgi:Fic family protein
MMQISKIHAILILYKFSASLTNNSQEVNNLQNYRYLTDFSANQDDYMVEFSKRVNNISSLSTGLFINPDLDGKPVLDTQFNVFYVQIPQISFLKDRVFENSKKINDLLNSLPKLAKERIFFKQLVEEIQSTNQIENVSSTTEEIEDALVALKTNSTAKELRFTGLLNLYMNFRDNKYNQIKDIKDFRIIYDDLLKSEISNDKLPDGTYFRTKNVSLRNSDNKMIHKGVTGESVIIDKLSLLINFMNSNSVPSLEKCFISHYFFEYIHPFYDGNGRTGRFIACSYLSKKLDYLSAISFSSAISKQKSNYLDAFSKTAELQNKGEITRFIMEMLSILAAGQSDIILYLEKGQREYTRINKSIERFELPPLESRLLQIYTQFALFANEGDRNRLTDIRITKSILKGEFTRRRIDRALSNLVTLDLIMQIHKKPSLHRLSSEFIISYGL